MVRRIYSLDTCGLYWIVDNGHYDRVLHAVESGLVELRYTCVQVEQVANHPDLHQRVTRLLIMTRLGTLVNARVFALGFASYLGFIELSDDTETFDAVAGPNLKHGMDAVIACGYARGDGPIITTDDRLMKRGNRLGFGTIDPKDFVALLPDPPRA